MSKSSAVPESLLAALRPELAHGLFAKARTIPLSADQILFAAGDEGDGCYRVDEGLLKASVTEPGDGERILAILGPGSVVGELSMLDGVSRSASVIALRDSKLSFISRAAFQALPYDFASAPTALHQWWQHRAFFRLRDVLLVCFWTLPKSLVARWGKGAF